MKRNRFLCLSVLLVWSLFYFPGNGFVDGAKSMPVPLPFEGDVAPFVELPEEVPVGRPHLIQTVTSLEEYAGMLQLGMLVTPLEKEGNLPEAMEAVEDAVVRIEAGSYYGSGVVWEMTEEYVYFATNRHVLLNGPRYWVILPDGWRVEGIDCGNFAQGDIGFLKVPAAVFPEGVLKSLRAVRIDPAAFSNIQEGTEIFLMGSADGVAANRSRGTVLDKWKYFPELGSFMIHSDSAAKPGMSGGGMFDVYGNLVGMVTGGAGHETASLPLPLMLEAYGEVTGQTGYGDGRGYEGTGQ